MERREDGPPGVGVDRANSNMKPHICFSMHVCHTCECKTQRTHRCTFHTFFVQVECGFSLSFYYFFLFFFVISLFKRHQYSLADCSPFSSEQSPGNLKDCLLCLL